MYWVAGHYDSALICNGTQPMLDHSVYYDKSVNGIFVIDCSRVDCTILQNEELSRFGAIPDFINVQILRTFKNCFASRRAAGFDCSKESVKKWKTLAKNHINDSNYSILFERFLTSDDYRRAIEMSLVLPTTTDYFLTYYPPWGIGSSFSGGDVLRRTLDVSDLMDDEVIKLEEQLDSEWM